MRPVSSAAFEVGVVGAGAMGQGVAQVSAQGGMRTLLHDAKPGVAEAARLRIAGRLDRLAEKGRVDPAAAEAAKTRLVATDDLADLSGCDAVIEAVYEDADLKRAIFARLEEIVAPDAILASNTSSIPIGSIARACRHRSRVAGMHFFNPVPLMKLVEVISGPDTAPATAGALEALGRRFGRVPVLVKDSPGFLVNLGGRAYATEALRLQFEGVASPAQIDAILRDCLHFRMGPFELMDLTGLDVNFPVSMIVYEGFLHDPRIATTPLHRLLCESGRHGRKTGQGWYAYDADGRNISPSDADHAAQGPAAARVALVEPTPALAAFAASVGFAVAADDGALPLLAAPLGEDATTLAARTGADFRRLVAVDLSGDVARRTTLMQAPGANRAALEGVAAACAAQGLKVTVIGDSPGFVAQRMRAVIGNLGTWMAQIGLAEPEAIDMAMKLGLNYPLGPLEMVEAQGVAETHAIMLRLQEITGEDRYRPSLWLRRRALLGLPAHQPA